MTAGLTFAYTAGMRAARLAPFAGLLAISAVGCAADATTAAEGTSARQEALFLPPISITPCDVYVPSGYATVQQGVDAVCDGGTVHVAAGTYTGTTWVSAKRVTIVGAGSSSTALRASDAYFGVVTFVNGGRGEVRDLALNGAYVGVMGWPAMWWGKTTDASVLPGAVTVRNVAMATTQHGVGGQFGAISVLDSTVWGGASHGVAIFGARSLTLSNTIVSGTAGVGVHAELTPSSGCGAQIVGGQSSYNALGGIELVGAPGCPAWIRSAYLSHNRFAGITLRGAGDTYVSYTTINGADPSLAPATYGKFGDGIYAEATNVTVSDSTIAYAKRAAISMYGRSTVAPLLSLSTSRLQCNGFDIELETGAQAFDGGANACSQAVGQGCSAYRECHAQSQIFEPIPIP